MTDNNQPPRPEDMGEHLDEEIKETVHDWAENTKGTDYDNLDARIDEKLRKTIAGWVGAAEDADWKTIGSKMDARTRAAIAKWVGTDESADWAAISSRIENRTRAGIARLVRAERKPAEGVEAESAEASWADIGTKIEHDVRGWVAGVVGTEKDADWQHIGNRMFDHARSTFDKAVKAAKDAAASRKEPSAPAEKITIEGEDESPVVKSSTPVDPEN